MDRIQNKQNIILAASLIFIAAFSRFLPHPPNFTPIMAMSIFGGAMFADKRFAFLVPLLAMFITDAIIGFHSTILFVYSGFAIGVLLGFSLKNKLKPGRLALTSLAGSSVFFILTNFGAWLTSGIYPKTIDGLMQAYFFGLPFFRYTPMEMFGFSVLGDLTYCFVFYAVIVLVEKYSPKFSLR
jgi:hypothetical protein